MLSLMEPIETTKKDGRGNPNAYQRQRICTAILESGAKCKSLAVRESDCCRFHTPGYETKKPEVKNVFDDVLNVEKELSISRDRYERLLKNPDAKQSEVIALSEHIRKLVDTASTIKDRQQANADSASLLKDIVKVINDCVKDETTRQEIAKKLSDLCRS